jgi:hypothetical protein
MSGITPSSPIEPFRLPIELCENIFKFFSPKEAGEATLVCQAWKEALKKDRTSFTLQIDHNRNVFSTNVIAEIPTYGYPDSLIHVLRKNGILMSKFPKYEVNSSNWLHTFNTTLATCRSETGLERIAFRMIGKGKFYRQLDALPIRDGGPLLGTNFENIRVIFAIFKERKYDSIFIEVKDTESPNTHSFNGSTDLNYRALEKVFGNPISIVWLYCGGDTPYIDLRKYLPVTEHQLTLY